MRVMSLRNASGDHQVGMYVANGSTSQRSNSDPLMERRETLWVRQVISLRSGVTHVYSLVRDFIKGGKNVIFTARLHQEREKHCTCNYLVLCKMQRYVGHVTPQC